MPRKADGGFNGIKRRPPLNSTTISLARGSSFKRCRTASGITTWYLGETVTVFISITPSYGDQTVDTLVPGFRRLVQRWQSECRTRHG